MKSNSLLPTITDEAERLLRSLASGSECDPDTRTRRNAERFADLTARMAAGHFLVVDPSGSPELLDPAYTARTAPTARWVSREDAAAYANLPSLQVGQTARLVRGYHPRHGLKYRTVTRVA